MHQQQPGALTLTATDELLAAIFDDAPSAPPRRPRTPSPRAAVDQRDLPWPGLAMGSTRMREAAPAALVPRMLAQSAATAPISVDPSLAAERMRRALAAKKVRNRRRRRDATFAGLLAIALGIGWGAGLNLYNLLAPHVSYFSDNAAVRDVVERIIRAESGGDPNAKNPRSTAAGAAQFLDGTWLELVRAHRPDLRALNVKETLDLRQDARLAREMTARFAERHAAMLTARGLPVTAGTLYLAHFAGGAGAAALLTARDDASAAEVMAKADSTGRTTREKIVQANPFLEKFTVADIKRWADRKVRKHRPQAHTS
ncbi:MAG: hypothetical protein AB7O60_03045 [Variibacter sp.]